MDISEVNVHRLGEPNPTMMKRYVPMQKPFSAHHRSSDPDYRDGVRVRQQTLGQMIDAIHEPAPDCARCPARLA